jgi:hypothetical protein
MNNVGYSSLDEAFSGPLNPPPPGKKQRKHKKDNDRETMAYGPGPLEGSPDPDRLEEQSRPLPVPEPMHGPSGPAPANVHPNRKQGMGAPVEATMSAHANFFPLPGTTANTEEWEKAFMLEPTQNAMAFPPTRTVTQNLGASVGWQNNGWKRPVDGKNTLWRSIPEAAAPLADYESAPGSLQQRLDDLTKKLDSLTGTSTPMNGTAELFLFVAIGLLLLLAIDTLLRFAASLAGRKQSGGSRMRVRGLGRRLR